MGELLDRFEPPTENVPLTAAAAEEHQDPAAAVIHSDPAAPEAPAILTTAEVHPEPRPQSESPTSPAAAVTPPGTPAAAGTPGQTPVAAWASEDQATAEVNQPTITNE